MRDDTRADKRPEESGQSMTTGWQQDRQAQEKELGIAGPLSHALHNPLGAISLHLGILAEEIQQLDAVQQMQAERSLAIVERNVKRLRELIQQYLLLERLGYEERQLIELGDLLQAVGEETQRDLSVRDIRLALDIMTPLGELELYEPGFRQALYTLVFTVATMMPNGGELRVVGSRDRDCTSIECTPTGEHLAPMQIETAYDPFYPSDRTAHGLGLYFVREVVKAHRGDMISDNAAASGTKFQLYLPRIDVTAGA